MDLKNIGRYEVKSEIAQGGMATVYHAYDPRFERDVAVKVLPQAFLHDPQFRVRFEREAKMIALLEHPAIVPVYDFGEESGQPYIVMRFMSGGSLTDRLKQGQLSIEETSQMISRLAPALDAAHARNIIHRDLKPGNILFDQYGNAYLSDFGIARIGESGATLTGTAILGTPTYMSPEQVQGDKNIDGRSDIYALGVLLYQMISGKAPYHGDTPAKVMMMHVLEPVPNILEVKGDLPVGCQDIITRAMAKDPEDRYGTTGELAAALENVAKGLPPSALPPVAEAVSAGRKRPGEHEMATVFSGKTVASSAKAAAPAVAAQPAGRSRSLPIAIVILVVFLLIFIIGGGGALAFIGFQGSGPLAFLAPPAATATQTSNPISFTATSPANIGGIIPATTAPAASPTFIAAPSEPPTSAPPPSQAPTLPAATTTLTNTGGVAPGSVVIGGADKIAYLNSKDIWVANLDGTGLTQLTKNGTDKINLQWTPDGKGIDYISGKCAYTVHLDGRSEIITCFNFVDYFKAFEISPDGKQVALSLDNQMYVLPYDLEKIRSVQTRADLTTIAECKEWAPYTKFFVKYPRWSRDGKTMAMIIMGVAAGLGSADTIQVIPSDCNANPHPIDNFPPPRYMPPDYVASPTIQNFGWDGFDLFTHSTFIRNGGFGNLFVYNKDTKKAQQKINPVNGACCYRDPQFSPDGTQLLFAFQKYPGGDGSIQFYMIPYGSLSTGLTYQPLPLPSITNPVEMPQPVLRPAR